MNRTAVEKIKDIFSINSEKNFVTQAFNGKKYSYKNVQDLSSKLASFFLKKGIKKKDKIAILLPNCIEYIIIYFACMQIGAVAVPINQKLHDREVKHILDEVIPKLFLVSSDLNFSNLNNVEKIIQVYLDYKKDGFSCEKSFLNQIDRDSAFANAFENVFDDDSLLIIYTSGTTGFPKGIEVSYKRIISNGLEFIKTLQLPSDLNFYAILDLAYLGGFYNLMLIPFLAQASIVLTTTFNPGVAVNFWDEAIRFNVNALWLVPSILSILLMVDRSDKGSVYSKDNIKIALVGTAPLSEALKEQFENKYSIKLNENYGLSETFFISTHIPNAKNNKGVGKILKGCIVLITDINKKECDIGQEGDICVKTIYGMNDYFLKGSNSTADSQKQIFNTGDIGFLDKDGNLHITGRKKDLIIRGGINISPKQIEDVLSLYPGISDVAVIGIQDQYLGEEIVAVFTGKNIQALNFIDIKNHCKKYLASFKVPSKFFFKEDFPRSVTGKIHKEKLKNIIKKEMDIGTTN